jgi:hypothetical protein
MLETDHSIMSLLCRAFGASGVQANSIPNPLSLGCVNFGIAHAKADY